jgi:hypothetical protein
VDRGVTRQDAVTLFLNVCFVAALVGPFVAIYGYGVGL